MPLVSARIELAVMQRFDLHCEAFHGGDGFVQKRQGKVRKVTAMSDVEQKLREYIVENFLMGDTAAEFGNSTSFLETGLIDSTGVLELVEFLEETYGIEVHDAELLPENLDSIANIRAYLARKQAT